MFRNKINMYSRFISMPNTNSTRVVEINPLTQFDLDYFPLGKRNRGKWGLFFKMHVCNTMLRFLKWYKNQAILQSQYHCCWWPAITRASTGMVWHSLRRIFCIPHRKVNTLRLRPNGQNFADDNFKCIFFKENVWSLIKISLKFVPKGQINNIPALAPIRRQAIIWTNDE